MNRKRLVSWVDGLVVEQGWVRDPVKRQVMIAIKTVRKFDPHSALGGNETRTVTGATKPAQNPRAVPAWPARIYKQELFNP